MLEVEKAVSAVLIFCVCFVGGIIPISFSRWCGGGRGGNALSYANCIGGGVLLGAALIHLLVDAEKPDFEYPIAHLLCAVGFLITFTIQKIIFNHSHVHPGGTRHDAHSGMHEDSSGISMVPMLRADGFQTLVSVDSYPLDPGTIVAERAEHSNHENGKERAGPITTHEYSGSAPNSTTPMHTDEEASGRDHDTDDEHHSHKGGKGEDTHHHPHTHRHTHEHHHEHGAEVSSWILFSVLAIESFVSGSALGVQDKLVGVVVVFTAISTHIWAESFALVTNFLLSAKFPGATSHMRCARIAAGFSAITPLGILVGALLAQILKGYYAMVISSSLMALAAGTFLYVAVVEVLMEEFEGLAGKPFVKAKKLALLLVGFVFMSILAIWL